MYLYNRNIRWQLWLLRSFFVVTVALCAYFFRDGFAAYGYLLAIILLFSSVISFTGLRITSETVTIHQFYCFGLVWRTWRFNKGDAIEILPFKVELSDDHYAITDSWWDIIFIFIPASKVSLERYVIKHTNIIGKVREVKMKLTEEEYGMIVRF